jgi:protein BCP1
MPIEVVPHMYRMLADEIQWACDDGEPYHFDHFLLLSRTYTLSDEEADATLATPQQQKRRKGALAPSAVGGVSTFHHEDLLIQQVCLALSMHAVRLEGNKLYSKAIFKFARL